jgi:hypothetical protein
MRYPAIASVLLVLGCSDQEPTRPTPFDADALIQAHSPSHYGVSANVSLLSTPAYTEVNAASAAGTAGSLHLSVDAGGAIPRFPDQFIQSVAVFGYGWVDAQTGRGVVAVIHPLIGRDSHQNPDGWHTHPVTLGGGTASSTFCLAAIGTSQGGISIRGGSLGLNMALRQANVAAGDLDVAASFVVVGDAGCPELAPGVRLGVQVLAAQSL